MMNYKKEGQGINGEIPKDGQQQTLCTHRRALYSCQSKHMVRPRRQTWSASLHSFCFIIGKKRRENDKAITAQV